MKVIALAMIAATFLACGTEDSGGGSSQAGSSSFDTELCAVQVKDLRTALEEINSRLDIGMNYQEYGTKVADTKVVYDRLEVDTLEPQCLSDVAVPLEKAFNEYIDAYKVWNRCFENTYCTNDDIQSKLQNKWAEANVKIEEAVAAL